MTDCYLECERLGVCRHLADQLIMTEHTEPPHHAVVLHTLPTQLNRVVIGQIIIILHSDWLIPAASLAEQS